MNSIKKWLLDKLLGSYLKGILDKLPLDGFKTVIGVLLIVLAAVSTFFPQYSDIVNQIIEFLKPYGADLFNVGLGTFLTGLVHKILKKYFPNEDPKK